MGYERVKRHTTILLVYLGGEWKVNMRLFWRIYAFILILASTLSLMGCHTVLPNMDSIDSTGQCAAEDYLVELNEENRIIIKLPSIYQQSKDIGKQMEEHICRILENETGTKVTLTHAQSVPEVDADWYSDGYSEYAIFLDSRLMLCNDEIVSVVFEGMMNYRYAAHPINLFFTLNYNPKTNREVFITDIYDVDDSLYNSFVQSVHQKITSEGSENWVETQDSFLARYCSREAFSSGMSENGAFYYYFTDSGIGISFPVPHTHGDHMEVEIAMR